MKDRMRVLVPTLAAVLLPSAALSAQTIHKVTPLVDVTSGPAAGSFAGLGYGFRQQILIDEVRLQGLLGKSIQGLLVRRDLDLEAAREGGDVELKVYASRSPRFAAQALDRFGLNGSMNPKLVFDGTVSVPSSPVVSTGLQPWDPRNVVRVKFSSAFTYTGGTLCLELIGHPVSGKEPAYWPVDHQRVGLSGSIAKYGATCSKFAVQGQSLFGESTGLQIGSTARLISLGRPGSTPLMLLGAQRLATGVDLTPIGAPGCHRHIDFLVTQRLAYNPPLPGMREAFLNFMIQVPAQNSLLGVGVQFQFADLETALPRSEWSNPAGLTTSNGVELRVSTVPPSLQMSVVRSDPYDKSSPLPVRGAVDVDAAPVLRLLIQ